MAEAQAPGVALRTRSMEQSPTIEAAESPARGRETRTALLQKLRPPPLVHAWDFWLEKESSSSSSSHTTASTISSSTSTNQTSTTSTNTTSTTTNASISAPTTLTTPHSTTLTNLHSITDVRHFWTLFNNFSFSTLPPRISVHLFHATVTPTWEDARNASGGSWTFRLPRAAAGPFFRALAVLAISEQLQEAVRYGQEGKQSFRDEICGIGLNVKKERAASVTVWNRDCKNEVGKQRLVECVLANVPGEVRPEKGAYYYKAHSQHVGFVAKGENATTKKVEKAGSEDEAVKEKQPPEAGLAGSKWSTATTTMDAASELESAQDRSQTVSDAVNDLTKEYEKVRQILDEVKIKDAEMDAKLAAEADRLEGEGDTSEPPKVL